MSKLLLNYSTYLISKSSFLTGIGEIFDFAGSYEQYNTSDTEAEADAKATLLDWLSVGDDLRYALDKFKLEKNRGYEPA
ncbi:MAG: hypothetical protein A2445_04285 [Candidatus Jacksonbacteria bacterium RIFOXYC2_FULL_44_29]|nr:MAG: hypothetical protein UW45_C0067G0004 [Parcubacteria group bacterium GW2011_GWC2_44_22]OGY74873.1 MAG: hypothetical protein A2240_01955 [Candidatus Jacksonbacteria bacterium RIFOXYA2_FULL_43_12]OGY75460.1 MAG: hypothetical protein A2295_05425 [Candidatus Jacksonbacteria bacterium RIFOXYB2_FULL_44_15]OGY78230.1 MAG: hypothetical protein A2445_04285 [Candidatus Jacksonbacteria bacterium RIFOXYC2_FULL_44_29]OGY80717.1 MAG: hypothetical protein A2550_00595 [Candidatus Jacksonbacteria bacteri